MPHERAREIQKKFVARYGRGKAGTIVGGDGAPVELGPVTMSCFCAEEKVRGFGCSPNVVALLVEYLPARKFPPRVISARFPKKFMGLPVYYKRGHVIRTF